MATMVIWLVVEFQPLWKMELKSVGMMIIPNIWKIIKNMFQTTKQLCFKQSRRALKKS